MRALLRRGHRQFVHRVRPGRFQHRLHGLSADQEHHLVAQSPLSGAHGHLSNNQFADHLRDGVAGDSGLAGREDVRQSGVCGQRGGSVQIPHSRHIADGHVKTYLSVYMMRPSVRY